jgi:hypothetical protein
MLWSRTISAVTFAGAVTLGAACSNYDSPSSPVMSNVAGAYQATTFTRTSPQGVQDVLQSGGSLVARFDDAGRVTGHITIPSESIDSDFSGTWTRDGNVVVIEQVPANLVIGNLSFAVSGTSLVSNTTVDGTRVQVTLTKQ